MRWGYGLAAGLVALVLVACASAGGSESRASSAPPPALAVAEGSPATTPAAAPGAMEKIRFAVPQVNVFILSFSFRIIGGLAVFGFTLQLTAQHVLNYLRRLPDDLLILARLMAG